MRKRSQAEKEQKRRKERLEHPEARKRRFLLNFWETLDADAACAAAGVSWRDMCKLRDEDPDFAAEWERAIDAGYERIELMLLRLAGGAPADETPADTELARELIRLRLSPKRPRLRPGAPKVDREARLASIVRKLTRIRVEARQKDGRDEAEAPVDAVVDGQADAGGGGRGGGDRQA